jgi:hypothetical protein
MGNPYHDARGRFTFGPGGVEICTGAGLVYRRSGAKIPVSTVHSILRNRLYTGWFE